MPLTPLFAYFQLLALNLKISATIIKKVIKKLLLTYIFLQVIEVFAQIGGNSVYSFLNLSNSARVAALGGQSISIADNDLNLVYNNPALLSEDMSKHLAFNYIDYFADVNYGYVSYADNFHRIGTLAFGLQYVDYGKFTKANEFGNITGKFKAFDLALNLFYSFPLFDSLFRAGVNFKPIYSKLENYTSYGLACDFGINYQSANKLFSSSFVIKNIGSQLKPYYHSHYEALPFDMQIAVSQKLEHAPIRFSLLLHSLHKWDLTYDKNSNLAYTSVVNNDENEEKYSFNIVDNIFRHSIVSAELLASENFIIMLGYNHKRRQEMSVATRPFLVGFSAGVYIKISKFRIGYGSAIYHLAGASQHFSVSCNLNDFIKRK